MRIDVIALFPEWVETVIKHGVVGRAFQRGLLSLETWNPRDYTHDTHRTVDDRPYGGGPGMVLMAEPLRDTLNAVRQKAANTHVIYFTPQGAPLKQQRLRELGRYSQLTLVAGRYEGVDQRFIDRYVDEEIALGDYVISGGELAAMVMIDGLVRLLPGALGDPDSAEQDSFSDGIFDSPHYTRPEVFEGLSVPSTLLSGDHAAIAKWRRQAALAQTLKRRPELLSDPNVLSVLQQDDLVFLEELKQQLGIELTRDGDETT